MSFDNARFAFLMITSILYLMCIRKKILGGHYNGKRDKNCNYRWRQQLYA